MARRAKTKTKTKRKTASKRTTRGGGSRKSGASTRRRTSGRRGGESRGKKGVKVDFTDVESRILLPEGEYDVKVGEVSLQTSEDTGNDYLAWVFRTQNEEEEKYNNQALYFNTALVPQSLWNLRALLETLGVDVPSSEYDLDFGELEGLEMVAVVEHERWEGKKRARLVDFMTHEMADGGAEPGEEEEVEVQEDAELPMLTEAEIEDMEEKELLDLIEKYDLELDLGEYTRLRKKCNAVIDAIEEKGYLETAAD